MQFHIVFFFAVISISLDCRCQIYFSKRYFLNDNSAWSFSSNIISEPFGYTLQIEDGTIANPGQRRLGFLRLDPFGNKLSFLKIYQYDTLSLGTGYGGCYLNVSQNNGYALAGYLSEGVSNGRYDRGILMRFDNNMDTLWTKLYTDVPPHDSSIMFQNFRELSDKGYIIIGLRYKLDGNGFLRANLFRVDSLGNLKWQKTYGPEGTTEYYPSDITNTTDNGFVIGASYGPYNSNTQGTDPIIIKVDSVGNQQWLKHLGNSTCFDGGTFVDRASDGNIQIGTIFSDSCYGNDGYFSRINFVKIGNNEGIIWDKKYGLAKYWNGLNKIKVFENGDIIGTGTYYKYNWNGSFVVLSWIIKIDSAGNEKWYREYELVNGEDGQNNLFNISSTFDNGIIACGMVYPTPPDTGFENSWVLKVDSLGCQGVNDCWVGMNEIIVKTFTPDKPFVIYPNPATEKFSVEFHENPDGADIEVRDMFGNLVFKSHLRPYGDRIDIDAGRWNPGIYFVRVLCGERILGVEKVVIQ